MMDSSLTRNKRIGEATKRGWADPEERARRAAGIRRVCDTPEFRARMSEAARRSRARKVVIAARLPLWKWLVDHAVAMLKAGTRMEVATDSLRQDFQHGCLRRSMVT